jgi:predicted hotdog family 3-hydroxylacyl-ACP dehydratase
MRLRGDDIKRLIPQRDPFMMVDEFEQRDDQTGVTLLTVRHDNYFRLPDDTMAETGLIEHIAQSCSALAGSKATGDKPPVGMIAEVKHFGCHRRPAVGEQIDTTVTFGFSFGQMTMAHGESRVGADVIAEMDLKIFMQ